MLRVLAMAFDVPPGLLFSVDSRIQPCWAPMEEKVATSYAPISTMGGVPLPVSGTEGMFTKRGWPSRSVVTPFRPGALLFPASMAFSGEIKRGEVWD